MRWQLREATREVHERLHGHAGFAAVAAGSIGRGDYRALLLRLLGFHRAFDTVLATAAGQGWSGLDLAARSRSALLAEDLAALGLAGAEIETAPVCTAMFEPAAAAEFMGALYVVEGSALGGRELARALEPRLPGEAGRHFFLGRGRAGGAQWADFLAELQRLDGAAAAEAGAVRGAQATFAAFEGWMADWRACPRESTRDLTGIKEERTGSALI